MANHEPFANHMLKDWKYSGPECGIGAKPKVTATLGGRSEAVEMEVIAAERPNTIVEQNVGAHGRRIAAPLVRAILSSANQRALTRLAEQLPEALGPAHTGLAS